MAIAVFANNKVLQVEVSHKCGRTTVFDRLRVATHTKRKGSKQLFPQGTFYRETKDFNSSSIDYKLAVVRDPVNRLISCYKNRVVYKGLLGDDISWEDFIDNLDFYKSKNKDIDTHSSPQYKIIGDPNYYDRIINTTQLSKVLPEIIYKFTNIEIDPSKRKTSSSVKQEIMLTDEQKNKIKKIYKKDYELYGDYF